MELDLKMCLIISSYGISGKYLIRTVQLLAPNILVLLQAHADAYSFDWNYLVLYQLSELKDDP